MLMEKVTKREHTECVLLSFIQPSSQVIMKVFPSRALGESPQRCDDEAKDAMCVMCRNADTFT